MHYSRLKDGQTYLCGNNIIPVGLDEIMFRFGVIPVVL